MKNIALIILGLLISQTTNAEINCEDYITNEWPDSRYNIREDGTAGEKVVVDNQTGLMWKQCSEGSSGSSCATGGITNPTWENALLIPQNTFFGGYGDWRLPNIKEFQTLVAKRCYNPSINRTYFPNTPWSQSWYWTSSPAEFDFGSNKDFTFVIEFGSGIVAAHPRSFLNHVRLVRNFGE